jgi:hypothetical protein
MSLSSALKSDFEQPIRDMPNRVPSWRQIHEQESSLDRTLKEAEKVQAKLDKAGGKRTPKTDALQSELNGFHTTLNSLAPKTYKTFQCLDEDRLRVLKEVVVRWATTRADLATKDGQRAESSLTKLLSWETNDDVIAVGNSLAGVGRAGSVPAPSSTNTTRKSCKLVS